VKYNTVRGNTSQPLFGFLTSWHHTVPHPRHLYERGYVVRKINIHPLDAYAGQQLREARKLRGLSQAQLGERIAHPITFQQIQKYESGDNRLCISRLHDFAEVLKLPLYHFLPDSHHEAIKPSTHAEVKLLEDFRHLPREAQNALLIVLQQMQDADGL
jgi:transcriptional regulator with XRE-family HTH domain